MSDKDDELPISKMVGEKMRKKMKATKAREEEKWDRTKVGVGRYYDRTVRGIDQPQYGGSSLYMGDPEYEGERDADHYKLEEIARKQNAMPVKRR